MVAFTLANFGGQIPKVDDHLLPESNASLAKNTWLFTGVLEGVHGMKSIHTLSNPSAKKVFRVPYQYYDKDHFLAAYWMEFDNPHVDVIRSPTLNDDFERFYWASSKSYDTNPPYYNTKDRIIAGQPPFLLGVPAPTDAPRIAHLNGKYQLYANSSIYSLVGRSAAIYYSTRFRADGDTFSNADLDVVARNLNFNVVGSRAQMVYKTVSGSNRITISDGGVKSVGVPANQISETTDSGVTPIPGAWAYLYTWVTAYGEESAPSPAYLYEGNVGEKRSVTVTPPPSSVTNQRNITTVRIYRTVTASAGSASYYQIGEMPIGQTVFTDLVDDATAATNPMLESLYWTPPPADLEGFVVMPNGIVASWRGNEIWFCEPYRPHAWPVQYQISVEYPIVGLGVTGQTLIVLTSSYPTAVSGINPASMASTRIANYQPCVSRGSIISSSEGVLYASPNGVVLAYGGLLTNVTENLLTKDKWLNLLTLSGLNAARINGAYYCWGSPRSGVFEPTAWNMNVVQLGDYTGSRNGALIAYKDGRIGYTALEQDNPMYNVFEDAVTGEVMTIHDGQLWWLDTSSEQPRDPYQWKSKIFTMPNRRNLEAMRVWWNIPSGTTVSLGVQNTNLVQTFNRATQYGLARVYADGNLVFTRELRTSGELFRLPSGFKATYWQIEIEGQVSVYSIETATSAKELLNV